MADFEFRFQLDAGSLPVAAVFERIDHMLEDWDTWIRNLLFSCNEPGAAVEYIFTSSERHPGHTDLNLIMRDFTGNLPEKSWKQLSMQESEQFAVKLGNRRNMVLCVPGENRRQVTSCYVPGGYELFDSLDLRYIRLLLSEYRDVGMSLLIKPSYFTEQEKEAICSNLEWIGSTFPENPLKERAMHGYRYFEAMQAEKMFFFCITLWGQGEGFDRLTEYFAGCGMGIFALPQKPFSDLDYRTTGSLILPCLAERRGHVLDEGIALPAGCERMNFLTTASEIVRMLTLTEETDATEGKSEHTAPGKSQEADPAYKNRGNTSEKSGFLWLGTEKESGKEVYLPLDQLTKHMVIAGMSGSGKTSLLFQMISELEKKNLPFLIIEPVKTEYRGLIKSVPDLQVLTPGRTDVCPVMFNPFLPPKGIKLEQFLPNLVSAFQMAFSLTTPLDVILPEVIRNCYVRYNWRNDSTSDSSDVQIFGMHEFICAFKEEIQRSSYDPESKQNLNSGGVYRLQSLINNNPYLFDTDRSLDLEALLHGRTLIELDGIDNPEHKTLFLALLLLQLKLMIHKYQKKDSQLKNVILIDEAHVLLGSRQVSSGKNEANPVGKLQEYLLDMVKENRVYGTGMIFADQSLAILQEFVNNSNIKIAMHLESAREREFLTENLNLSPETYRQIASLQTGEYFLFYEKLEQFQHVRGADHRKTAGIPKDVDDETLHLAMKLVALQPFRGCPCKKCCDLAVRNEADFIARKICNSISGLLGDEEALKEYMRVSLDDAIYDLVEASDYDNEKRLTRCARMMTERMVETKTAYLE